MTAPDSFPKPPPRQPATKRRLTRVRTEQMQHSRAKRKSPLRSPRSDACAVGSNCLVVHDYDRPINVSGYNPSGSVAKDLKTVSAALAYDDPISGETVILMVHQAIHIPDIAHNLLSTMQLRLNDVIVNDVPRFLTDTVHDLTHSLAIPTDATDVPYVIPLSLRGVTSTFPTRRPTVAEYETLPHITLTDADLQWDPHDTTFAKEEDALTNYLLETGDRIGASPPSRQLCSVSNMHSFANELQRGLDVPSMSLSVTSPTLEIHSFARSIASLRSSSTGKQLDPQLLARNWGIDITTARRTVFATSDGWCRAYPMAKKSLAHAGLSQLFQREGVPNVMVMDGAREQTMGLFRKKCREVGTRVRQTEPHTPWSNAAEAAIRELKKGIGRQMVRSVAPKRLWDDCLEREAYVRSLTSHDIYKLDGQVPETVVSGETADISPFALFKWYEWVMFRDTSVTYPDDSMVLGRDLGPAIDIGPAMTRKVLKQNEQVVYRSSVQPLTPDELADESTKKKREEFTEKVNAVLGDCFKYEDFATDPELVDLDTPTFSNYADDDDGEIPHVPDADDEPDADTHDQYVGAEVTLPIGDKMLSAKVRNRKRAIDGSLIGKANSNPILDTRTYEVEFADGQTTELSANVIAQNMYLCNVRLGRQSVSPFEGDR
ncbi:hypothetical protein MHU86_25815 [Fragilaria crotonensis]|nr:hypothetical protein MHU86_25815 [Fragilaria crotonensis]